jgi:threonine/homoserine/homoserine lactone efflux protein
MTLAAFASMALIHLIAAISPGPAFVVILRVAAAEGLRNAVAVAIGFGLGAVAWAAAALMGLAVLFQIAPVLLTGLKLGGAAFLLFIAFMMWRHASDPLPEAALAGRLRSFPGALKLGLMTQLANPKAAVFFGAVFIGVLPEVMTLRESLILLALVFAVEFGWYVVVARIFSLPHARAGYARIKSVTDRVFGGLIAAFGIKIATT